MKGYSNEIKKKAVGRMKDGGTPIGELAEEYGVTRATLYNWQRDIDGIPRSNSIRSKGPKGWSSEDKFNAVLETSSLNEYEKTEYCRRRGIFIEQLKEWEETCRQANAAYTKAKQESEIELRKEQKRRVEIERELRRKDKALAEAAALLVLRKKAEAIWGDQEED